MYSTLLFDLDHTLLDSDASEAAAYDATMHEAGVTDPDRHFATYRRINGELWAAVEAGTVLPDRVRTLRFELLIDELHIDADAERMADRFVQGLAEHGELFPGAAEVLMQLSERCGIALVTNGLSDVQRIRLDRLGIADHFDAIVISAEVGHTKPRPEIFDIAFAELGEPSRDAALMIGDSLSSDMRGGVNAGIATCWYNPDGTEPGADDIVTHEISHLDGLLDLVP